MEQTTLGDTDLEVSKVGFGAWQLGGNWGGIDVEPAKDAIERALELGITLFDTAQAYGQGRSEEILGEALADDLAERRDEIVLATKGGLRPVGEGAYERDSSPGFLDEALDDSLDRLGVDHVDLYQVHWPDPDTPLAEVGEAMDRIRESGRADHVGVSNYTVDQMEAFREGGDLDALQPPFSMLRRDIEGDQLRYCRRNGIGVLVYGPLAHGILAGKYDPDETFPDDDWRRSHPMFESDKLEANLAVAKKLREVAEGLDATLVQLAVAWTLQEPAVDVALVGCRTPKQVETVAPAAELEIPSLTLMEIEEILEDAEPIGGPSPEGPIAAEG